MHVCLLHARRRQLSGETQPEGANRAAARYLHAEAMNENFSLIVMCLFLLGSLAFLAQQLTSYH
jgi:hypothetical protein